MFRTIYLKAKLQREGEMETEKASTFTQQVATIARAEPDQSLDAEAQMSFPGH